MEQIGAIKDRVKASTNPYPEYIIDESSGIEFPSQLYTAWQKGYDAGCQAAGMGGKVVCNHANNGCEPFSNCEHRIAHIIVDREDCDLYHGWCGYRNIPEVTCIPVAEYNEREANHEG